MNPEQEACKLNMLKAASEMMHALADQTKNLQEENSRLIQELELLKASSSEKVNLEKVASVSEEDAVQFSSLLVSHSILDEADLSKCAKACLEDPNSIIKIAIHALKSSELPAETGRGIKSASSKPTKQQLKEEADRRYFECFSSC